MVKFNFQTKPYEHQKEAFDGSAEAQQYALLIDMGTGKTKVTIDNLSYLYL